MSRAPHMTWRVSNASSSVGLLDTLIRDSSGLRWVFVAKGGFEELKKIAEALNRARFTLYDIRPVKKPARKKK